MIAPSKFTPFGKSILSKTPSVVGSDKMEESLVSHFQTHRKNFSSITEYIYTLDTLFVLGVIDLNYKEGTIVYVKRDH